MVADTHTSNALTELSNSLADAAEHAGRAVVAVHGRGRYPSSGVHWQPGLVVTSNHTIERDEDVAVTALDGTTSTAQLAGRDPSTDLAVLKISSGKIPAAEFANLDAIRVGHFVLALAAADTGLGASLGVLSALGPAWTTWRGGHIDRFIRADLDLFPGFSGGPLVDVGGRVIGVNTSGLSRRFDLTISASTVTRVVEQLLSKGHITRGYLGLGMQPIRLPETQARALGLSSNTGIIVVSVEPEQAADKAGVLIGDVLVALEGSSIEDPEDILTLLGPDRIGKQLAVRILRAGALRDLTLTVGERAAEWD